jgi:hypothetical protein
MSTNIIEAVQKQMGYKPLHKVSPNTQEPVKPNDETMATDFEQAVVVSVLAGLYNKSKKDDDTAIWGIASTNMLQEIFGEDREEVVMAVANYAHVGTQKAETEMHRAGVVAMQVIDKETSHGDAAKAEAYLTDQRQNILSYLPSTLHMGDLLHDPTMDDRTNKMEGPVSSFMHKIEGIFSSNK